MTIINRTNILAASVCVLIFFHCGFGIAEGFSRKKCATLYSAASYQGMPYSITEGDKQLGLGRGNIIPNSAHITPDCALTIYDVRGNKKIIESDSENLGWNILDAWCCECGGCRTAATRLGNLCGRLFENTRCDTCSGYRLDLKDGDRAKKFGVLENKMSSVALRPGCTLNVYTEAEFSGNRFNFTDSSNMMGDNWDKQISSAICGCERPSGIQPIRSTWPPAIDPVQTSRPTQISLPRTTPKPILRPTESSGKPYWFGGAKSDEIVVTKPTISTTTTTTTTPTTTTTTTTTTTERNWSEVSDEKSQEDTEEEEEPEEEEEDEESNWYDW